MGKAGRHADDGSRGVSGFAGALRHHQSPHPDDDDDDDVDDDDDDDAF